MMYEPPINPPCDKWEEYDQPKFIESLIEDVASDINQKGYRTNYKVLYDVLYMHIKENIEKYYPDDCPV